MTKPLNWKDNYTGTRKWANAARLIGGDYHVSKWSDGFHVKYRERHRRKGYLEIGLAATEAEAFALAQADHDQRLAARN
jgi:hypothetical protein